MSVHVEGAEALRISKDGSLVIETALGPVTQPVPKTWQMGSDGKKRELICNYMLLGADRFGFMAPGWDGDTTFNGGPGDAFVSRLDMGVDFYADRFELFLKQPGTQQKLTLNAGKQPAGRLYWVFGSMTGTAPGVTLNGMHIPLNPDLYTDLTIGAPGLNPPFLGFKGTRVEFYSIVEGGHGWPQASRKSVGATQLIWKFFEEHGREAPGANRRPGALAPAVLVDGDRR